MKCQVSEFDSDSSSETSQRQGHPTPDVNIYKHLSQANPLLDKIYFDAYHVNVIVPVHFTRLPKELRDTTKHEADTNMNRMEDSVFYHSKMRDKFNKLVRGETVPNRKHLDDFEGTLFTRYGSYAPHWNCVYRKFPNLNQDRKYFATPEVDLKGLSKKKKTGQLISEADFFSNHNPHTQRARQTSLHERVHPLHKPIHFDSNFEGGNLFAVYQKSTDCFELVLQNDINTRGNNQWFYFRVKNVPRNKTIRFQIVNLIKEDSLFNYGMKPTVFSESRYFKRKTGWVREGQKVNYEPNNIQRQRKDAFFHTLSFEYKFVHEDDTVYFSHSYPYTYSDLSNFLLQCLTTEAAGRLISLKSLGRTVGKNKIDLLTVTSPKVANKYKKIVWILARQHPGQITSSFMIQGILTFLTSGSKLAQYLLQRIVFKVVPMVNSDGVIHGNSRCQLVGSDPNRKWKEPSRLLHPVIAQIKKSIQKGQSSIDMILDLHSHSRKLGTFFYGNSMVHQPSAPRLFPLFVCKHDQRFSFQNSRFGGGYNTTARSVLYKLLRIPRIYTIECSFYAYQKDKQIIQYLPDDYRSMGRSLLENYASLIHQEAPQITIMPSHSVKKTSDLQDVKSELELPEVIKQGEEDSGSESDLSGQELDKEDLLKLLPHKKIEIKKKLKKKIVSSKQAPKQKLELKKSEAPVVSNDTTPHADIRKKVSDYIKKAPPSGNPRESLMVRTVPKYTSLDSRPKLVRPLVSSCNKGVQTDSLDVGSILSQHNSTNRAPEQVKIGHHLCVIGLKVQQKEVWVLEGQVGTQTVTFPPKSAHNKSTDGNLGRRSLRIPKFLNALQLKENNFVSREYSLRR